MTTAPHTTADADPSTDPGRLPTFLYIGTGRCASNWTHRCLQEHPEIFTATPRELHFFHQHWDKGQAWYMRHFHPEPEHRAWGEKSPGYLAHPDAAHRIREMIPDVRLFATLRDPAERAFSYYMLKQSKNYHASFEEALESDPRLLTDGRYAEHLERWFELFPREQLLVQLYEDLMSDEVAFIQRVYSHIGVDASYRPTPLGQRTNAVVFPRMRLALRKMGLKPVMRKVGRTRLGTMLRRWNHGRGRSGYKPMPTKTLARLREYYDEPNRHLERLLGVDVSGWCQPKS